MMLLSNSCTEENYETRNYGNSMFWVKFEDNSKDLIENLAIEFTTKDVYGKVENRHLTYIKSGGFIDVDSTTLSFPYAMKDGWQKVYEGLDETDSITFIYNGNRYTTRGWRYPELQRCVKINWKTTSVEGGDVIITNTDIEIIEQEVDIAINLNQKDDEKINLFYPALYYYDFGRSSTRFEVF